MNTETKYTIQPITKTTVKTIEKFSITLSNFILFTSVDILVCCYDIDNNFISTSTLTLDASNGYENWLNDDSFLITWVKEQMSFEDVVVVETVVEETAVKTTVVVEETAVETTVVVEETAVETSVVV